MPAPIEEEFALQLLYDWDTSGEQLYKCVTTITNKGSGAKTVFNVAVQTYDDMLKLIDSRRGWKNTDIYYALGTQRMASGDTTADGYQLATRKSHNMVSFKALFIDIDVKHDSYPTTADAEAALSALNAGTAELAIVENSASYRHPAVRTVAPLYPSVLHIGVRPEKRGQTLGVALNGATVFAGTEQTAARELLNRMASMYAWSGIEFSYVDSFDSGPDVIAPAAITDPLRLPASRATERSVPSPPRTTRRSARAATKARA